MRNGTPIRDDACIAFRKDHDEPQPQHDDDGAAHADATIEFGIDRMTGTFKTRPARKAVSMEQ